MSLPELFQAVEDLKTHSDRLELTKTRRLAIRDELTTLQAAEEEAKNAVESTQKLVSELAAKVVKGGK